MKRIFLSGILFNYFTAPICSVQICKFSIFCFSQSMSVFMNKIKHIQFLHFLAFIHLICKSNWSKTDPTRLADSAYDRLIVRHSE